MQKELKDFAFSFTDLDISVAIVEEAMGYGIGQTPDPFPEMIATALEQSVLLCDIKGSLLIFDRVTVDKSGSFIVHGVTFQTGKKIASQLREAEGCALFMCTAGPGIGKRSSELMATHDFIEGYIYDVIGSVTVEAAIDRIQDGFESERLVKGMNISNRYSPGYCGWSLNEQKQFFTLFPDQHCGIKLSESCLMDPVKSISGVIGFGSKVKKTDYECQMCELESCLYRKIRTTKMK